LAEATCVDYKTDFNLPIVIFRPSIVTITESDPFIGWCDNFNGPQGLLMVAGLGLSHVAKVNGQHDLNTIPVDICAKGMLIAAFKEWKDRQAPIKRYENFVTFGRQSNN
jgi:alcohol-forming fatty acyl-CoA reductase